MADSFEGRVWPVIKEILTENGEGEGINVEALAVEAIRRDPSLPGKESTSAFVQELADLLYRRGLLNGKGPGATLKALTSKELREAAGLSLEGHRPANYELAALALAGSRPSGAAAGCRPAPPARTADQVRLSLDLTLVERARAVAAERDEHERLGRLLLGR